MSERKQREFWIGIAIFVSILLWVAWQFLWPEFQQASSTRNMKAIHAGLERYLDKHGEWPQLPDSMSGPHESGFVEFWKDALEPHGVTERMWHRPGDGIDRDRSSSSYIPTMYGKGELTPYRSALQPWLIERSNFGGDGPLVILPDGKVMPSDGLIPGSPP